METESPVSGAAVSSQDQVLIASRILAAIIIPILVAAFIILYLFPNDSGRLFAWPIKPPMSAMMLGATYLGGAYYFTRVVLAKRWHTVQLGFIPVTAFASLMGIATLLHWEKFSHGKFAFELWALLYFGLPFVIPAVWYLNQRASRGSWMPDERRFSSGLRLAIGMIGGVLLAGSTVLLVFPAWMIPVWPWTITPLTARVLAAMFILPGLVGLGVAFDGRWSSASTIFQAQALAILLFLAAMAYNRGEIHWGMWSAWTFLGGLLLVLVLIGWAIIER